MSYTQKRYHSVLEGNKISFNNDALNAFNAGDIKTYIQKNAIDKELYLFLLKDLKDVYFKKYIIERYSFTNNEKLRQKYYLNNHTLPIFCQKMLDFKVKKVSIVKFVLEFCTYYEMYYNDYEFYAFLNSFMHFSEEEREQLQKETILLTFRCNCKKEAQKLITTIETESKNANDLMNNFSLYNDVVYLNSEFIDYDNFKKLVFSVNKFVFNHIAKEYEELYPKQKRTNQLSTMFFALAIKKLDLELATKLVESIFEIMEYRLKPTQIDLINSYTPQNEEEKKIIESLKGMFK